MNENVNDLARRLLQAERTKTTKSVLPEKVRVEMTAFFGTTPHMRKLLNISPKEVSASALHKIRNGEPQALSLVELVDTRYSRWRRMKLRFTRLTGEPLSAELDSPNQKVLEDAEKDHWHRRVGRDIKRRQLDDLILQYREVVIEILVANPDPQDRHVIIEVPEAARWVNPSDQTSESATYET